MTATMRPRPAYWQTEAHGLEHATIPNARQTLCGLQSHPQFWKPGLLRCPVCVSLMAERKEGATAPSR